MAKQNKKQPADAVETVEKLEDALETQSDELQRGKISENFANADESEKVSEVQAEEEKVEDKIVEKQEQPVQKQKSGGTALALLALLVALGVGGAGHFLTNQKFADVEKRLAEAQAQVQALSQNSSSVQSFANLPSFDAEKAQIAKLEEEAKKSLEQFDSLQRQQGDYAKQFNNEISNLQTQLQKLGSMPKPDATVWLLSDADFLLTNALRKVVIDNDLDTAKSLLIEADNTLSQVNDPQILTVREAIKTDLNLLSNLNKVDQNNVMQRLAQLANLVDDMPMLDNEQIEMADSGEVSDSIQDWQQNIEKSANSFLNHFIRISDKNKAQEKAFIAPNQEIYLRENIRLRLQIAILAVPRQQNELYKQSLEAVSTWVRSYFDVQNENVKNFLREVDDLIEQSIYIDAPNNLQSLNLLKQKLNRLPQAVEKIQIEAGKAAEELKIEKPVEETAPAAQPAEQQ